MSMNLDIISFLGLLHFSLFDFNYLGYYFISRKLKYIHALRSQELS